MIMMSKKHSQKDYADAQCELGHKYRTGDGVKKDIKKAIYHYRNADENGDLIAHWYLCKLEREQDDRRLKYIIMPAIFAILAGAACLSEYLHWNDTLVGIVAAILCCLIVTLFVIHSKK